MTALVDVAIVGAGPYGLSLAAHLRSNGVRYRQFGIPMNLWRRAMPRGMYLKSQGFASNLSDPDGTHTLAEFCRQTGRPYSDRGMPVSLETFVSYGNWFQQHRAPDVEEVLVTGVTRVGGHYEVGLADGEEFRARNVVVATGVEYFSRVPEQLAALPAHLCSHSSAHDDLSGFRGRDVVVLGAGQSALETAALLHENGADVRLVARASQVRWNGPPLTGNRSLYRRVREPEAGLGSGLTTWFYSEQPWMFRHLPPGVRANRARNALGPAGAWWLRERVEGQFPVLLRHTVDWARSRQDRVRLGMTQADGRPCELRADHVISATGFPPDLRRLDFLSSRLRSRIRTLDRTPQLGGDFQSSVPGLFFIGPSVAPTFGPAMRFVYGADYASRQVAGRLVPEASPRSATVQGAAR